jgi:AcrR family transcriptional regulator
MRSDAAHNKKRILEYAESLNRSGLLLDAKMRDIASGAGVGVGTFYRNFPNKRSLCFELLYEHLEKMVAQLQNIASNDDADPEDQLISALSVQLEFRAENNELISEIGQAPYNGRSFYESDIFSGVLDALTHILGRTLVDKDDEQLTFISEMTIALMRSDIFSYEQQVRGLSNQEMLEKITNVIIMQEPVAKNAD